MLLLSLLLLLSSSSVLCSDEPDELVQNEDRLTVLCFHDRMHVLVKNDFEQFSLNGTDPECEAHFSLAKEYDGTEVKVKHWSLPLTENRIGACGLTYSRKLNLWTHSLTVYGPDWNRTATCTKAGILDKRGAHIRLHQITPKIRHLVPKGITLEETIAEKVKVPRRATIRAAFISNFPLEADISLHPMQCWLVNERRQTKRLVLDYGCPLRLANNKTVVSLSAETASSTTSDHPFVAFNADTSLFEDEDGAHPFDLPSFRLQCSVWPCRGLPLHQQITGVARCPSVAWCEMGKKLLIDSNDKFEVDQLFSLSISSSVVAEKDYYPLGTSFAYLPPV